MLTENGFTFPCDSAALVGVLHDGAAGARRGVLIVVGGPQYRVGSHRQFLLLARHLAAAGIPTFRFDHSGMGDAEGEGKHFEDLDRDIRSALDAFLVRCPRLEEIVIWGLCDAASAALLYAWRDPRVTGLVLLNPWVRTRVTVSRAYLKHYYSRRLFEPVFWRRLFAFELDVKDSTRSLLRHVANALEKPRDFRGVQSGSEGGDSLGRGLPERMANGFKRFSGRVLLVLSGADLTAAEFKEAVRCSQLWQRLLEDDRVSQRELEEADHIFSRKVWRDQVAHWTREWIESW